MAIEFEECVVNFMIDGRSQEKKTKKVTIIQRLQYPWSVDFRNFLLAYIK